MFIKPSLTSCIIFKGIYKYCILYLVFFFSWKVVHLTINELYLLFRENEAAGQLQLIHQLEAGLRKQQQIIDVKDKVCVQQ